MNFELDDDQVALRDAVVRLLADNHSMEQRRVQSHRPLGAVGPIWSSLAEIGLTGLLVPESCGGSGRTIADVAIVQEAIGRALMPEAYWMSAVAGVACLKLAASAGQQEAMLPGISDGKSRLAIVSPYFQGADPREQPPVTARKTATGWLLEGRVECVAGADVATSLVVHASVDSAGGNMLFLVDAGQAGVRPSRYRSHDGTRGADLVFEAVAVTDEAMLAAVAPETALSEARADALAALCCESVGAMSVLFDMTLDYLRTRKQFGVTLSSFQALQHRAVDMLVALERARSMAVLATCPSPGETPLERDLRVSAAKVQICQSARFVGQQAIQLHGGIGMTDEYAAGHFFRRLTAIELALGPEDVHLATVEAGLRHGSESV